MGALSKNCEDCGAEIGGYLDNKVYRFGNTNKCQTCGEKQDPITQLAVQQTGLTPLAHQRRYGVAWNE